MRGLKRLLIYAVVMVLMLSTGCQSGGKKKENTPVKVKNENTAASKEQTQKPSAFQGDVEALIKTMTLDEKIGQMIQGERATASPDAVKQYFLGSILSGGGSVPGNNTKQDWVDMCKAYQDAAKSTRLGIPILYGADAVHGHNNLSSAVIFPHNIGLGAAGDPQLMSQIAGVTAEEMISTGVNWTFAPCVASAQDIRWGRTYESYSENPDLTAKLAVPYISTLQDSFQILASAKHFIADGAAAWGSGDSGYMIDQGDAAISEQDLRKTYLPVYEKAVKAGVKSIMVSYSSWNGLKNHQNQFLIQQVLKGELGFKGFVTTDSEGLHQVKGDDLHSQVVTCVNAGVDMFMEPEHWKETLEELKKAVEKGEVSQARIDDAVTRILQVKWDLGLFQNPLGDQAKVKSDIGSDQHREVAQKAVRESLVLLKNAKGILPLKKNAKIYVTGPAANDVGVQCGGWTKTWQGGADGGGESWMKGSTLLDGFKRIAGANGGTVITDKKEAKKADVVVVAIGEVPYAEGHGDDGDLDLFSGEALEGNKAVLDEAKATGLPVVVVMISGRPRIVTNEIKDWDAFVEAWLPGTEGGAAADVLYGDYEFQGKLPFTWPRSVDQLPMNSNKSNDKKPLFPLGYGLTMKK